MFRTPRLLVVLVMGLLLAPALFSPRMSAVADGPTVPIRDLAFPFDVPILVGETVIWVNEEESLPHDVTSGLPGQPGAGELFRSPLFPPGEAFSFTFTEVGIYDYFCAIHPNMRGTVTVTEGDPLASAPVRLADRLVAAPFEQSALGLLQPRATVVASGLLNPRGFTFAPDGALVVAESGAAPPGAPFIPIPPPPDAAPLTTKTGRISRFDLATGQRTTMSDGLPSSVFLLGDTLGPASVAFLGSDLYVAIAAGPVHGWPFFPSGVYRVNPDGTVRLVGNTDAFNLRNPVAFIAPDEEISNPYDMIAGQDGVWVSDGNVNQVYRITPAGAVSRVADLSTGHPVTTGIARAPDGALIAVELTAAPFVQGSGRILRIGMDGQVTTLFRGTTAATGVAVASDGTIYVVEYSISLGQPPFFQPGSGRVARLTPDGRLETVVGNLASPTMARIGPDRALYVTNFSTNADNGEGQILRVDVGAAPAPVQMPVR
jgi:plastocyanin